MLDLIGIQNLKSIREATISLGRLTILIGLNGSGKSSILQGLVLLRQSLGSQHLVTSGPLIDLGAADTITNRAAGPNGELSIAFAGNAKLSEPLETTSGAWSDVRFASRRVWVRGEPQRVEAAFDSGPNNLRTWWSRI